MNVAAIKHAIETAEMLVARGEIQAALATYHRAASAGSSHAALRLGQCLLHFSSQDAQRREGLRWVSAAAEHGDPNACHEMAALSLGGVLLPSDSATVARHLLYGAQTLGSTADRAVSAILLDAADQRWHAEGAIGLGRCAKAGDVLAVALLAGLDSGESNGESNGARKAIDVDTLAILLEAAKTAAAGDLRSQTPQVKTKDALLSAFACAYLRAAARPHLRPSHVIDPTRGEAMAAALRTSSDCTFDPIQEDVFLRLMQSRMCAQAAVSPACAEHLVVLRYLPGEEYRPHRDYLSAAALSANRPEAGQRMRTICVYLNEVDAGGETEFSLLNLRIEPRIGRAVVFDNLDQQGGPDANSLHAGLPVIAGEKWLATLWLRQHRYRYC